MPTTKLTTSFDETLDPKAPFVCWTNPGSCLRSSHDSGMNTNHMSFYRLMPAAAMYLVFLGLLPWLNDVFQPFSRMFTIHQGFIIRFRDAIAGKTEILPFCMAMLVLDVVRILGERSGVSFGNRLFSVWWNGTKRTNPLVPRQHHELLSQMTHLSGLSSPNNGSNSWAVAVEIHQYIWMIITHFPCHLQGYLVVTIRIVSLWLGSANYNCYILNENPLEWYIICNHQRYTVAIRHHIFHNGGNWMDFGKSAHWPRGSVGNAHLVKSLNRNLSKSRSRRASKSITSKCLTQKARLVFAGNR